MLTWAVSLIVLAVVLFVLEAVVPSMGVLGALAVVSMVAGIVCVYRVDTASGLAVTVLVMILAPLAFIGFLRAWPHLPVARWLMLRVETPTAEAEPEDAADGAPQAVGALGQAVTQMRPTGTCRFGERRVQCVSVGGMVEAGAAVKVVSVNGMEIKVKPV
jgi:membrane-bound serine protease (ClpP class)